MIQLLSNAAGAFVGGVFVGVVGDLRLTLLVGAILNLGAIGVAVTFREPKVERTPESTYVEQMVQGLRVVRGREGVALLIGVEVFLGVTLYVMAVFRPLYLQALGLSDSAIAISISGFLVVAAIWSAFAGTITRILGEFGTLALLVLMASAAFFGMFGAGQFAGAALFQVPIYIVWSLQPALTTAFLNRRLEPGQRATVLCGIPPPRGACRTLSRLSVFGLALLAQELREIVVSTRGLPRSAGHLPTAKRLDAYDRARRCAGRSVRVQDAGLDFREEPPDLRRFAAEDSRGEAVVHVVRDLDRVLEVVHRDDRQDRHEELFLVDPVVPRQPVHDRRLDEVAASLQRLAAGDDRSLRAPDFRDRVLEGRHGCLVDDGPQVHVANGRVAHIDFFRLGEELGHERILHALVDEDPRARGALLTAVAERAPHDPDRGLVQIRPRRDDRRILPAHLRDDWLRARSGERLERLHPDGPRPPEDETVHVWYVAERLSDGRAWSRDEIERARRKAGVSEGLGQTKAHERRVARRLEDDRVARDQRTGRHPGRRCAGGGGR